MLEAQLKAATAGIKPEIPVKLNIDRDEFGKFLSTAQKAARIQFNVDTSSAVKSITDFRSRIEALSKLFADVKIGADDKQMTTKVVGLEARATELAKRLSNLRLDADSTALVSKLASLNLQSAKLQASMGNLKSKIEITAAVAQLKALQAQAAVTSAQLEDMRAGISSADLAKVEAALLRLESDATQLKSPIELRIDPNAVPTEMALLKLQLLAQDLTGKLYTLRTKADTAQSTATIAKLQAQATALTSKIQQLKIGVDVQGYAEADAQLLGLFAAAEKLKRPIDIEIDANARPAETEVDALKARAKTLAALFADMRLKTKDINTEATLARLQAQLIGLTSKLSNIKVGIDVHGFATAEAELLGLEAALEKVKPAAQAGDAALSVFTAGATGFGGVIGFLGGRVKLFGGVLQGLIPEALASVAVWHIVLDALVEIGAVVIPAAIALTAFGIAGSDAAKQIQQHMQVAHTVLDATNLSSQKAAGNMEALHKSIQPKVFQLYGDMLTIVNSKTDNFGKIAKATGTVVDQLAARFTFAVTQGKGLGEFMKNAVKDVALLGDIIGNLGGIFGNVFKVIPGFAVILLGLADSFTKVLESASRVAEPFLRIALLLHGYILYIGLGVTASLAFAGAVANLAKSFILFTGGQIVAGIGAIKGFLITIANGAASVYRFAAALLTGANAEAVFGKAGLALLTNPLTWVAAAAIAMGALIFALARAKDAAQNFNAAAQDTIKNAQLSEVISTIHKEQALSAAKLAGATQQVNKALSEQSPAITGAASHFQTSYNPALDRAQTLQGHYIEGSKQLSSEAQLVTGRMSSLSKEFGSNAAALGILNAAGITSAQITDANNQHWAQALIQIHSTVAAYTEMGAQAGQLGNDLDVLGRTLTDQYQAVKKLNDAWDSFTKDVTSTQTSFDTVAQGFSTLNDHSGTLRLTLGKLKVSYADAHVAIDSLTPAGVALNQAFSDQVTNIGQLANTWRTAGLANSTFKSGITAAIAPMEKYAVGSKEATAQLVALAEQAGYQGPISLQAMNKYLGITSGMLKNTSGDTQKLKDAADQATAQEALLTGAMQSQGNLIANQLLGDLNQAIIGYYNVAGAVKAYGLAVARSGKDSQDAQDKMKAAILTIVKSELSIGDNAKQMASIVAKVFGVDMPTAVGLVNDALRHNAGSLQAAALQSDMTKSKFETLASAFGKNKDQADALWKSFRSQQLDALAGKAGMTQGKFEQMARQGFGLSKSQADTLWISLKGNQQLDALAAKASTTRGQFEQMAAKFGLTKGQADTLWISLKSNQQLSALSGEAGATRGEFEKLGAKFGLTKDQSDALWNKLRNNPLPKVGQDAQDTGTKLGTIGQAVNKVSNVFDDFRHRTAVVWDGIRHDISSIWDTVWSNTIGRLQHGINDLDNLQAQLRHNIATQFDNIRHDISSIWDTTWNNTIGRLQRGINDVDRWQAQLRHNTATQFDNIRHDISSIWDTTWNNTIGRLQRGISDAGNLFGGWGRNISNWYNNTRSFISNMWNTIWDNTGGRISRGISDVERQFGGMSSFIDNLFTRTIPDAFNRGVQAVGRVWNNIFNTVKGPVNNVLRYVINPLFGAIDDVTSFVGLGRPLPTNLHLAAGGKITGGTPGRDSVVGVLMPGEVVVPTKMVEAGAVDHLRGKLPGFASGGMVNPIGAGLKPERIDMGVDYGGSGSLYAIGAGTITSTHNSGWPGGGFIGLRLSPPAGSGYWYYAENVLPDLATKIGKGVSAGQHIATATGGSSGIEVGWAAPPGTGATAAAASGQAAAGQRAGDPGKYPTAWGVAASNLIRSLGGPGGVLSGPVQGGTGGVGGFLGAIIRTVEQILGGIGKYASIGIDLAKGNMASAVAGLLGTFKASSGGAKGDFGKMLLQLPVTLIQKAVGFLASKVKSFVSGQQAQDAASGGGGGLIGPVSGPADAGPGQAENYAQSRLASYGWSASQFSPLQNLWQRESNWSRFAKNPSSGAYGIPQSLPASKLPFAGQAGGGSHASPQVDWGLNYIKSTYGTPAGAWAHEVAHNWYALGGLVADTGTTLKPGWNPPLFNGTGSDETLVPVDSNSMPAFATGGIVGNAANTLRSKLSSEQADELKNYTGLAKDFSTSLHNAKAGSWIALHKSTIENELATLASRQSKERTAYGRLAGAGLTKSDLSKFATATREEATTSRDKDLVHVHPGWMHNLGAALSLLSNTATAGESLATKVVKAVTPKTPPASTNPVATSSVSITAPNLRANLSRDQADELKNYTGLVKDFAASLRSAKAGSWTASHKNTIESELATLAKRQASEQTAYGRLTGTGLTKSALSKFATATRVEATTSRDKDLVHVHPGWMHNLGAALAKLGNTAMSAKIVSPSGTAVPPLSASAQTTLRKEVAGLTIDDVRASRHLSHIWHLLHLEHEKELGFANGGLIADRGTVLKPGWNPVYNGTGQDEPLVPAGGGITPGERAILQALHENTCAVKQQALMFGQALNGTMGRAAGTGYYGG